MTAYELLLDEIRKLCNVPEHQIEFDLLVRQHSDRFLAIDRQA